MPIQQLTLDDDLDQSYRLFTDTASRAFLVNVQNNRLLHQLLEQGKETMTTVAELKALIDAEDTAIAKVLAFVATVPDLIKNAAPDAAALDALAADVKVQTDALTAGLNAVQSPPSE